MTYEEAAFCLQQTSCGDCPEFYECRKACNCSKIHEANKLAIENLKKQIPKRLERAEIKTGKDGLTVTIGYCPSCDTYLYQWKYQRKFCQYCGQAIDFELQGENI